MKPKRSRWDPKPLRTQLTYPSGRDLDPGLLLTDSPSDAGASTWWLPEAYDFSAVAGLSHDEWVNQHEDVPSSEAMLGERCDPGGARWMILEAHTQWREGRDEDDSGSYRFHWLNVQSYLVSASRVEKLWSWLVNKNFMGRWMPEGCEYHYRFLGEYPWATSFHEFKESFTSRIGGEKPPCRVLPTCNSLSISRDAYQSTAITVNLPARRFFKDGLRWDGLSGYRSMDGSPRFRDPS